MALNLNWWPQQELHLHEFPHQFLKLARLLSSAMGPIKFYGNYEKTDHGAGRRRGSPSYPPQKIGDERGPQELAQRPGTGPEPEGHPELFSTGCRS